ncbi:MAG: sulfotransferase [Gemmatimonadota bacterium]|nr:MAG: sulfotransferase [Gemmatimonadota bacterium]
MIFHAIGGLPRSGSTLLCNVLNQNPRFHASSTSCLPQALNGVAGFISHQDEFRSALAHDADKTQARFIAALRGMLRGWYSTAKHQVVFDKSRAWNVNALLLKQLCPDAKLIIVVRDLRAVFASIEKQHRKSPVIALPGDQTVANRAQTMFHRQTGMIGAPICGVEDILRRDPGNVILVKYESLVANPRVVLRNLYDQLGEIWFDHDLDNVENVATDLDALWLNKFPHEGSGKVAPPDDAWSDWISPDIAADIMRKFSGYNSAFGYA